MKTLLSVCALLALAQSLTACIVEEPGYGYRGGYHEHEEIVVEHPGGWCGERRHCH